MLRSRRNGTRRYFSDADLHKIICENPRLFRSGATITSSWLCRTFEIEVPSIENLTLAQAMQVGNRHQLRKTYYYVRLNKLLSRRGLVIRQETNAETAVVTYKVQQMPGTIKRLEAYAHQTEVKREQFRRLTVGVATYRQQWSPLEEFTRE